MSALTPNQQSVLAACAAGRPAGRDLACIPSLVKRGLVVECVEEVHMPGQFGVIRAYTSRQMVYRLTPEGLATYEKMRRKGHEEARARLDSELERDLATAKGRTRGNPDPGTPGGRSS